MKNLEDYINFESKYKNDIMDSDEIKMLEKIMESQPVLPISKSKQNKLSKVVKTNKYIFWRGKNEINVARESAGFKPASISIKQCLSCQVKFESEGKHNRMCQACRKGNSYED